MKDLGAAILPAGTGFLGALFFLLLALEPSTGREAAFSAALLCLVLAAAAGPFTFLRREGDARWSCARRGAARCAALGVLAALVCGILALASGGPVGAALLAGLFCGLYAYTLGSLGDLLRLPLLAAAVGILLLGSLHYWDDLFLLTAADRKASAALAFRVNAAAAASVSLGFDWIHAKALYTNNQTAETLVGVPLAGLPWFALKLAIVGSVATLAGAWRRA